MPEQGWQCNKCGSKRLEVTVSAWARLYQRTIDGELDFSTDIDAAEDGSHEWGSNAPMRCVACGHFGVVEDFDAETAPEHQRCDGPCLDCVAQERYTHTARVIVMEDSEI